MREVDWLVFCSQTGSEVVNICKSLQIKPYCIVTNNYKKLSPTTLEFIKENRISVLLLPFNPRPGDYVNVKTFSNTLITLNGWLRIIPANFIEYNQNIYNGHPGLITKFPELKGLDPQKKAFELKHLQIGSVVHKVTKDVDEGEVVQASMIRLEKHISLEEYYAALKMTSLDAWSLFFNSRTI